jgi:hypothetical protein
VRVRAGLLGGANRWMGHVAGLAGLVASAPTAPVRGAEFAGPSPASVLLFGSLEAGPSVFVTTGAKAALDRIDRKGFVALASVGGGQRRETAGIRATTIGAVVFGYQWFADWGVVALYAGAEGTADVIYGCGCLRALPPRFGLRLHGEIWARPSDETLFVATLILGSTRASAWGRAAWGYRALGDWVWGAYLGPEVSFYGDETGYQKWGAGLHATDVDLGRVHLRFSAGLQFASERQDIGPYVGLTVWSPW